MILAVLAAALLNFIGSAPPDTPNGSRVQSLTAEAVDSKADSARRNAALASLAKIDPAAAADVAGGLLTTDDRILRARAAWITAAAKRPGGVEVLRTMAREQNEESVIAIESLGRLRDPGSHALLQMLLETELSEPDQTRSLGRISALSGALADYADKADAALLARSVAGTYAPGSWVRVTDVGRTGGRAALPVLEDIFEHGKGWTVMAAGLAAARCQSPKGLAYVRKWLQAASTNQQTLTDARTDDPHGPKATDFLLEQLGVPADEVFTPELRGIIAQASTSPARKEQAWTGLLRMNAAATHKEILELAWDHANTSTAAAKIIVLNDETNARNYVTQHAASDVQTDRRKAKAIAAMLAKPEGERRNWRLVHGYTF